MTEITIRPAERGDMDAIMSLLRGKAQFDNALHTLVASRDRLAEGLFAETPTFAVLLAERGGEAVGFASYFFTYSTFLAKQGIWLDNIYVLDTHRGAGVGTALMAALATVARERDRARLEWIVFPRKERAIGFYTKHGAQIREMSKLCRADRSAIERLAAMAD